LIEKLIEKAKANGDKLTENRITILELMTDNPYVSVVELAKTIGISIAVSILAVILLILYMNYSD
ncbi:MAG: winged helix-turn-helix transcriptional regulator, partial [Candidatus Riflebacteria bacterium]|nr:winged helix-turn-helix transcriptional regulator [Candidatus Riflebacteria bacterium]